MNTLTHIIVAQILALLASSAGAMETANTSKADLTVVIEGIKSTDGDIKLSLDHNEQAFSNEDTAPLKTGVASISGNTATIVFKDIPYGSYAIKLFHDLNTDDELDTNLLGIPSEPYGISNNARAAFGLPDFSKAKFEINEKSKTVVVKVSTHLPSF